MASIRESVAAAGQPDKPGKKGAKGKAGKSAKDKSGKNGKADHALDKAAKTAEKTLQKAHSRDSLQALAKLAEQVDGSYRIVSDPPIVVPLREFTATYGFSADETDQILRDQFRAYRATLQPDRRHLLERFQFVDAARKVVGVGSVGTRAFIVLLQGRDPTTPCSCRSRRPPHPCSRVPAEEPLQGARRTGGAGTTDDAGRQRHLPRLDRRCPGRPPPLLAAAARHEGLGGGRGDGPRRAHLLRPDLRRTPARAHARSGDPWRSPSIWATATRSNAPSPTSPSATPTERAGLRGFRAGGAIRAAASSRGGVIRDGVRPPFPVTGLGAPAGRRKIRPGRRAPAARPARPAPRAVRSPPRRGRTGTPARPRSPCRRPCRA